MAAWYDGVEVYVELAWGAGPLTAAASRTWTDHSDACMSIDIMRGSQSEFGHIPPGTATIVLNDPGRVFDASNTAGAHYGSIVPMVPVRVRAGAVALFTGFVAAFVLSWPAGGKAPIATLTCVDGTRQLESARLPGSAYGAAVLADSPSHYWPLHDGDLRDVAGGVDLTLLSGDLGVESTPFPVGAAGAIGFSDQGSLGASNPESTLAGTVEVWRWPLLGEAQQVRVSLDNNNIIGFSHSSGGFNARYSNSTSNRSAASGTYVVEITSAAMASASHVAITADASTLSVYADGQLVEAIALAVGTGTAPDAAGFQPGFAVGTSQPFIPTAHVAVYATTLTAEQIAAHYAAGISGHPGECGDARTDRVLDAIGHPATDRNLEAGHTVLGPWLPAEGDALSAIRETVGPEQALFHFAADGDVAWLSRNWQRTADEAVTPQATFGDQVGEIRYTDDAQVTRSVDNIYNYSTVTHADGSVSAEDATSIAAYGEQRDSVSAGLIDDAFTARQLAAARVREHKDAADRIDVLTILPRRGNDAAPNAGATSDVVAALAGLDLGYRVAVNRRPTGGTGTLALEPVVRGIAHQIDMSAKGWRTTLYLAPAPTSYEDGPWLTLGDPTYGDIGIAAGNLIPY